MKRLFPWLTLPAFALAASIASADYHTLQVQELYSNADGTVQYIMLHEAQGADGEAVFTGLTLTSTSSHLGSTKTFTFTSDLTQQQCYMMSYYYTCEPTSLKNRDILIATQGFAALNVLVPDYIIPNGFLPVDGGTVNFASVDQFTYASLPVDGINALMRGGIVAPNVATNFSDMSASVVQPAANYQGLWFNPAEAGWGINFAQQGNTIFASWFTFAPNGNGTWLVMTATQTAGSTYAGSLLQGTGPAFNAVPFPPLGSPGGAALSGLGGTGSITFTGPNTAVFAYTLDGVTQTKALTRQLFGPQPMCTFNASPNFAAATNYTDLWWASPPGSEAGWGINLTHQGGIIFATWFTFDVDHSPMWLVVQANQTAANTYTGAQIFRLTGPAFSAVPFPPLGSPGGPVGTSVGSAMFTFANGNSASFTYTVNGVTQTKTITRESFGSPATVCQ